MMREKKLSRSRSIKVLDYAMSGPAGSANCEQFVEALGLKSLFSALMQKVSFAMGCGVFSPPVSHRPRLREKVKANQV